MTDPSTSLRVEQPVKLDAPIDRVWQAITDHAEFGRWFRVQLDQPFQPGAMSTGHITYPGHEGLPWLARVEHMEMQRLFAFRWFHAPDGRPPSTENPSTLVTFRLLPAEGGGTQLTITESGFEALGDKGREVMQRNAQGWEIQARHIAEHLAGKT
jgi:uncharacterized protein YndB with AHSA1/START domain